MRKIFALFLCLFVLNLAHADDTDTTPTISGVSYDGYLSTGSVININGSYLSGCTSLKVGNINVKSSSISDNLITISYKDFNLYSGVIYLTCGDKSTNYTFNFPYITGVKLNDLTNFKGYFNITGKNFLDGSSVELSGGTTATISSLSDTLITGIFSEDINTNYLAVRYNGNLSNLYKFELKIPHINYVSSENGFDNLSTITFNGTNLNGYNNSYLVFGDTTIPFGALNFNSDGTKLTYKLSQNSGVYSTYIVSNGVKTNTLNITIGSNRPVIKSILDDNLVTSEGESKSVLILQGTNFGNSSVSKLYLNGNEKPIYEFTSESKLIIEKSNLLPGDNFFSVYSNGKYSDTFDFINYNSSPSELNSYSFKSTTNGKNIFYLDVSNFDSSNDKVLLNGAEVAIDGKYLNSVSVLVDNSVLSGIFSISRNGYVFPKTLKFDISYESSPYINYVTFSSSPAGGVKFEISGGNFSSSTISQSNFSSLTSAGNPNVTVTDTKITGYFASNIDLLNTSYFSITKFNLTTSISFVGKDIGSNLLVYGPSLIKEFKSSSADGMFRPGDKVKIISNNVHPGDIITIGDKKIGVTYVSTGDYSYFTMPSFSEYKSYDTYITNSNGLQSNILKIFVVDKEYTANLGIYNNSVNKTNYYTDVTTSLSEPLYSLKLSNNIKDLVIKSISFYITGSTTYDTLGVYNLKLDGIDVGSVSGVSKNGKITFSSIVIPKSETDYVLSLYKKSAFTKVGTYKIILDSSSIILTDTNSNSFSGFDFSDFITNQFNVYLSESVACLDSESSNFYCNTYYNQNVNAGVTTIDTSSQTGSYAENSNLTNTDKSSSTDLSQDNSGVIYTQINIVTYKFKSSSYTKLNNQFIAFAKQAVNNEKYVTKLKDLETTINNILKSLYFYENSTKKLEKTLYVKKLKNDIVKFKELIK